MGRERILSATGMNRVSRLARGVGWLPAGRERAVRPVISAYPSRERMRALFQVARRAVSLPKEAIASGGMLVRDAPGSIPHAVGRLGLPCWDPGPGRTFQVENGSWNQ